VRNVEGAVGFRYVRIVNVDAVFVGVGGVGAFPGRDAAAAAPQGDGRVGDPERAEAVEEVGLAGYYGVVLRKDKGGECHFGRVGFKNPAFGLDVRLNSLYRYQSISKGRASTSTLRKALGNLPIYAFPIFPMYTYHLHQHSLIHPNPLARKGGHTVS
jgi:hypothetical protein